jgi:hypothetical protein
MTEDILFDGLGLGPQVASVLRRPDERQEAFTDSAAKLLAASQGVDLYDDPAARGVSLAQAWRFFNEDLGIGAWPCLLVSGRQPLDVDGIDPLVLLAADDFVQAICEVVSYEPESTAILFVYDGRTGHCVTVIDSDSGAGGITYNDPFLGDSLLMKHQNAAGIAAESRGDQLWHITATELAVVAMAAFVSPGIWNELTGGPGRPSLQKLRASKLWAAFGLDVIDELSSHELMIASHRFDDELRLRIAYSERGRIGLSELSARHSFLVGAPSGLSPLARAFVVGWLREMAPLADRPYAQSILSAILALHVNDASSDASWPEGAPGQVCAAYRGTGSIRLLFPMSSLAIETVTRDGERWTTFTQYAF